MKKIIVFLLFVTCSASAFAQFPLGGKEKEIKAYFNRNIPYASAKDFKTQTGVKAVRFIRSQGIGNYTFYFDNNGKCMSYVVTYGNGQLDHIVDRLNATFRPVDSETWTSEDTSVTMVPTQNAQNYFSLVYSKSVGNDLTLPPAATLAAN